MRAGGHMGQDRVTAKNLEVVEVIEEQDLLLVRGAVPGAIGTYVEITRSPARTRKATEPNKSGGGAGGGKEKAGQAKAAK
jgi:ribosomal protein L3